VHRRTPPFDAPGRIALVRDIDGATEWNPSLSGVDVVVHLAALAHVTDPRRRLDLETFRRTNTHGTLRLAEAAAAAGVRRFVFLSSIGVHGHASHTPLVPSSATAPTEAYAVSKLEAERGLRAVALRTGMEVVIVRAPMVYGEHCSGNLLSLLTAIRRGAPLPFGSVRNQRSLMGVDNLADFLFTCVQHTRAADQTFVIADKPSISTPDLIRALAQGMRRSARLIPLPYPVLSGVAKLFGRQLLIEKICGNLQIDPSLAVDTLGWRQPKPLLEGLVAVGRWFELNAQACTHS